MEICPCYLSWKVWVFHLPCSAWLPNYYLVWARIGKEEVRVKENRLAYWWDVAFLLIKKSPQILWLTLRNNFLILWEELYQLEETKERIKCQSWEDWGKLRVWSKAQLLWCWQTIWSCPKQVKVSSGVLRQGSLRVFIFEIRDVCDWSFSTVSTTKI